MTDPTRYVRDAIITALDDIDFHFYGKFVPTSAIAPYATVIVESEGVGAKSIAAYNVDITITLYDEFREWGGSSRLDAKADTVLATMCPVDGPYLSISGFNHASCRLTSTTERQVNETAVTAFEKILRFRSLIND